ncbi:hypothetical protein AB0H43_25310 [Hamadaea sp. NPDC050747]|uniref:hypothetical protein n=1 Tax=Hamadaea sp. NPDC050747 TaxID=3155789 RepID=UPI0033D8ECFC
MRFGWTGRLRIAAVITLAALVVSACDLDAGGSGNPASSSGSDVIGADFVQALPATLIKSLKDVGITAQTPPTTEAVVRGPFFEAAETEVATLDHLTTEQVSALRLKASASAEPGLPTPVNADHAVEIVVAVLENREATQIPDYATKVVGAETIVGTLHVGERTTPVQIASGRTVLVVGVRTGAPVSLEFLGPASQQKPNSGHTQSLDLRTGKRAADAVGLYYPLRQVKLGQQIGPSMLGEVHGGPTDGYLINLSLRVGQATLLPYTWTRGWAPRGQGWLVIEGTVNAGFAGTGASCTTAVPSGPATRSIEVSVNGKMISGTTTDWHYANGAACLTVGTFVATYAVPASARSIGVRVSLPGLALADDHTALTIGPVRGRTRPGPDTGRITFPA